MTPNFGRLLTKSVFALASGAVLIIVCYFLIDRPVAEWVHQDNLPRDRVFAWLTYPPPIVQAWAPVVLVALMIRRAWSPLRRWEVTCLAACVAVVLADQFRESLSFVAGRYWPATWIDNNPSWIGNRAYGFHPFHAGSAYGSFPSGHAARTLALTSVFWTAYPRSFLPGCLLAAVLCLALVAMDYHFVSDVIGGGLVGGIVGTYTAHWSGFGKA